MSKRKGAATAPCLGAGVLYTGKVCVPRNCPGLDSRSNPKHPTRPPLGASELLQQLGFHLDSAEVRRPPCAQNIPHSLPVLQENEKKKTHH